MHEFRSLASMLRPVVDEPNVVTVDTAPAPQAEPARGEPDETILREARFFRAHLREALDRAVAALLSGIARDVLARELLLAPMDLARIVDAAVEHYEHCEPLRVRVQAASVGALQSMELPVFCDEALEPGDVFLDLRNGSIDLSLRLRLQDTLERAVPQR